MAVRTIPGTSRWSGTALPGDRGTCWILDFRNDVACIRRCLSTAEAPRDKDAATQTRIHDNVDAVPVGDLLPVELRGANDVVLQAELRRIDIVETADGTPAAARQA